MQEEAIDSYIRWIIIEMTTVHTKNSDYYIIANKKNRQSNFSILMKKNNNNFENTISELINNLKSNEEFNNLIGEYKELTNNKDDTDEYDIFDLRNEIFIKFINETGFYNIESLEASYYEKFQDKLLSLI